MANVDVEIASRRYSVACRDGEEAHLLSLAAIVDGKAQDAAGAVGNLSEVRQLLFAALLLADEVKERRDGNAPPAQSQSPGLAQAHPPQPDPRVAETLERLAARIERIARSLETGAPSA